MAEAKKRILIAEDDPSVRKMMKVRLEHEGYEVLTAEDGEAVLERVLHEKVHLILLDIKMPKLNGLDVCRLLKQQPQTAGIPVIVYSGSERLLEHLADRCIEVGAADWLRKPFRTGELMDKIHRVFGEGGGEA